MGGIRTPLNTTAMPASATTASTNSKNLEPAEEQGAASRA
jgi:hypothetical protein